MYNIQVSTSASSADKILTVAETQISQTFRQNCTSELLMCIGKVVSLCHSILNTLKGNITREVTGRQKKGLKNGDVFIKDKGQLNSMWPSISCIYGN